jgi:hypothetical protein
MPNMNTIGRGSRATTLRRRVVDLALVAGLAATPMLASAQTFFDWVGPANGNYTTPAHWNPVGVPDVAGEAFRLNGGSASLTGTPTVDQFALGGGTLRINNASTLFVRVEPVGGPGLRGFGAGGTITLNSVGSITSFTLTGGAAGDRFVFGDPALPTPSILDTSASPANQISATFTDLVLVNRGLISGAGAIGANTLRVENASGSPANPAIIESARQGVTFTIDPPNSGWLNDGILRSAAGTLSIINGTVTQSPTGLIDINSTDANARVQIGATIVGGLLNQSTFLPGQSFELLNGAILDGVTLNTARVRVPNANFASLRGTNTINAAASFSVESVGTGTSVQVASGETTATLTGTGRLSMGNSPANTIRATTTGQTLINNLEQGIVGAGTMAGNILQVINNTLIEASGSAGLSIDPPPEPFDNNGTLRAAANSTLTLSNGQFQNTGGLIDAPAVGSLVILSAGEIVGGELASGPAGEIRVTPFGTLTDITVRPGATLRTPNGAVTTLTGAIVNNGTLRIDSVGSTTQVVTGAANVTISGSGQITSSNSLANTISAAAAGQQLTLSNTGGFLGSAVIANNTLNIVNNTSIVASGSAGIQIDPPVGTGVGFDNNGTLRAANASQVTILGGTFDNSNGVIVADSGGTVTFNAATITGGTIGAPLSGTHNAATSSSFTNITVPAGAILTIPNAASPSFSGTITLNGTLQLASVGSTTLLNATNNLIVQGEGQISLGNSSANGIRTNNSGDRVTINNVGGIRGAGEIGQNVLTFTNNSTFAAAGSTGLRIDPPGTQNFINNGSLLAEAGSTLTLRQGTFENANGVIATQGVSTVALESATIIGGMLMGSPGGEFTAGGNAILQDVTINPAAAVRIVNGQTADLRNSLINNGQVTIGSIGSFTQLRILTDTTLTGNGTISLTGAANFAAAVPGSRLTNQGNTIRGTGSLGIGTLSITNRGSVIADNPTPLTIDPPSTGSFLNDVGGLVHLTTGNINVSNGSFRNTGGTIRINPSRLLDRTGSVPFTQTAGLIIVNGEFEVDGNSFLLEGGTLAGAGTGSQGRVDSNVVNSGGIIAPGGVPGDLDSPTGILTIEGTLAQSAAGELAIQITDTTPGEDYDRLVVTAAATLGGTLRITLAPGYTPVIGDTFDVLTAASINGSFDNIIVENEPFDLQANLETQLTRVRITIGERCLGDYDRDGGLTPADVSAFFSDFEEGSANADLDQDGGITPADVSVFFNRFESGC